LFELLNENGSNFPEFKYFFDQRRKRGVEITGQKKSPEKDPGF